MISWPNWRSRMPARARSALEAIRPNTFRLAGGVSQPSRKSGALRWKKLSAWLWMIWPRFISRRSLSAAGGMLTAMMASPALAEASRWLTGQMPQMRGVMPGISL